MNLVTKKNILDQSQKTKQALDLTIALFSMKDQKNLVKIMKELGADALSNCRTEWKRNLDTLHYRALTEPEVYLNTLKKMPGNTKLLMSFFLIERFQGAHAFLESLKVLFHSPKCPEDLSIAGFYGVVFLKNKLHNAWPFEISYPETS